MTLSDVLLEHAARQEMLANIIFAITVVAVIALTIRLFRS